jgi:Putative adipose-regulatory protein (Seipin)
MVGESLDANQSNGASTSNILRKIPQKIIDFFLRMLWNLAMPLLRIMFMLITMGIISILCYHLLRQALLPKALLREPVYFDYSKSPPIAKVSLLANEKQWFYTRDCVPQDESTRLYRGSQWTEDFRNSSSTSSPERIESDASVNSSTSDSDTVSLNSNCPGRACQTENIPTELCGRKTRKNFLKSGSHYTVDVTFGLANSPKNLQHGKFMVLTTIFDSLGNAVAKSSRPVVVPYQSQVTLVIDALVKYPMRALGVIRSAEITDVSLPVMNDFVEPIQKDASSTPVSVSVVSPSSAPLSPTGASTSTGTSAIQPKPKPQPLTPDGSPATTEYLELQLSTADVDIDYAQLTIMPLLTGMTYYIYYFPYLSFILGVTLFTGLQVGFVLFLMAAKFVASVLLTDTDAQAEDGIRSERTEDRSERDVSSIGSGSISASASVSNSSRGQRTPSQYAVSPRASIYGFPMYRRRVQNQSQAHGTSSNETGRLSPPPGDWRRLLSGGGATIPQSSGRGRGRGHFISESERIQDSHSRGRGNSNIDPSDDSTRTPVSISSREWASTWMGRNRAATTNTDISDRDRDRDRDSASGSLSVGTSVQESTTSDLEQTMGRDVFLRRRQPFRA